MHGHYRARSALKEVRPIHVHSSYETGEPWHVSIVVIVERLSNIVEGKCRQLFDKNGILFLDEDPKDFAYILRALRNSQNVPTAVPKEHIDNILNLRDNLEIREIKFGYREQSNSFVSEYFLSVCR